MPEAYVGARLTPMCQMHASIPQSHATTLCAESKQKGKAYAAIVIRTLDIKRTTKCTSNAHNPYAHLYDRSISRFQTHPYFSFFFLNDRPPPKFPIFSQHPAFPI